MSNEVRSILNSDLRKLEANIAVLKMLTQTAGVLSIYVKLEAAQEEIRDALVELMPDPPLS
jgi:hypothetical protein